MAQLPIYNESELSGREYAGGPRELTKRPNADDEKLWTSMRPTKTGFY